MVTRFKRVGWVWGHILGRRDEHTWMLQGVCMSYLLIARTARLLAVLAYTFELVNYIMQSQS